MEQKYFQKVHRNRTKLKRDEINSKTYQKGTLKQIRFFSWKTHQKKNAEVASIFHASKLHQKSSFKWHEFFAHQNYKEKWRPEDVDFSRYWRWRIAVILTWNWRRVHCCVHSVKCKNKIFFSGYPKSKFFQR